MKHRLSAVIVAAAMLCVGLSVAVSINTQAADFIEFLPGVPSGTFEIRDVS